MARSQLTATSTSWVQAILLPQPPEWLGLQMCATILAKFCIFSRDWVHHVGQAGFQLLTHGIRSPLELGLQAEPQCQAWSGAIFPP